MPNFNIDSVTRIQAGVQKRNIKLTGNKRNPAGFCACGTYTGQLTCSPEPFYRGDDYIRLTLRVVVLPPDKNGYRRPIYKHTRWRPDCFTLLIKSVSIINHSKWFVEEATKVREREERKEIKRNEVKEYKPAGRPKLDLTPEQMDKRRSLQKKLSLYKVRMQAAINKNNNEVRDSLVGSIGVILKMLEAQTTKDTFIHNPLFDPDTVEVAGLEVSDA